MCCSRVVNVLLTNTSARLKAQPIFLPFEKAQNNNIFFKKMIFFWYFKKKIGTTRVFALRKGGWVGPTPGVLGKQGGVAGLDRDGRKS